LFADLELKRMFQDAGLARVGWPDNPFEGFPALNSNQVTPDSDLAKDTEDFDTSMDILNRLGLLRASVTTEPLDPIDFGGGDMAPAAGNRVTVFTRTDYVFTNFGRRFVGACRPPKGD
jgi:hypothetical protein